MSEFKFKPNDCLHGMPPEGSLCWVFFSEDDQQPSIAYRYPNSAGGWTNLDTWEDFNEQVKFWYSVTDAFEVAKLRHDLARLILCVQNADEGLRQNEGVGLRYVTDKETYTVLHELTGIDIS